MIWASTRDGSVTYIGPEWTLFTGQKAEAALGDGWLAMIHDEDRRKSEIAFRDACASMAAFTIQYRLHHVSGQYFRVVGGAIPSISPVDHSFIGYLGTLNELEDRIGSDRNLLGRATSQAGAAKPVTSVDIIADYLLLARATAQHAREDRLLASIDFSISEVMRRLGYDTGDSEAH